MKVHKPSGSNKNKVGKLAGSKEDVSRIMDDMKLFNLDSQTVKLSSTKEKKCFCYSCISAVDKTGFYLNVVPYSHLLDPEYSQFHRYQVLKVWVPPSCFVLFHKQLLHGGCKSEYDSAKKLIPDNRVFSYIIKKEFNEGDDEFPDHREVYPPENAHNCAFLNGAQGHCNLCDMKGFGRDDYYTIDPCVLYDKGYNTVKKDFPTGTVIFGDVLSLGFAIVTGPNITHPLRSKIYSLRDHFKRVHSGLTEQSGRCMVIPPSELSNSLISREKKMSGKNLFKNHLDDIVDCAHTALQFPMDTLQFYKPNIIFNRSEIPIDQKVHYDYIYEVSDNAVIKEKVRKRKLEGDKLLQNTLATDIELTKKTKKTKSRRSKDTTTQYYLSTGLSIKKKTNK